MKIYSFDEEHEFYNIKEKTIVDDKERFFVVLDQWNKNTMLQKTLNGLVEKGILKMCRDGEEITDLTESNLRIVANERAFKMLSKKYGFKFTTLDELAEEMR